MLKKNDQSSFEYLKYAVYKLHPDVPRTVFQPGFDRASAEAYLAKHRGIPFIIRGSHLHGFYSVTYFNSSTKRYDHALIKPPSPLDKEYTIWGRDQKGFFKTQLRLKDFLLYHWCSNQSLGTQSGNELRSRWLRFKKKNQSAPDLKAVLSLQTLDSEKVAFTSDQVKAYIEKNKDSVNQPGDGHTGLALASALASAPFVVVRSAGNRSKATQALSGHIDDGGLVVITGHSSADADEISGNYDSNPFSEQIRRGPREIVGFLKEAGLKAGSQITIVLAICFGAKCIEADDSSFAHKLAKEFANSGISTTIIASDQPVKRFGTGVMQDQSIHFSKSVGIDLDNVNVLFTEVDPGSLKSTTSMYKPHETLHISEKGLRCVSPIAHAKTKPAIAETIVQEQVKPNSDTSKPHTKTEANGPEATAQSLPVQKGIFAAQAPVQSDDTEQIPDSVPNKSSTSG